MVILFLNELEFCHSGMFSLVVIPEKWITKNITTGIVYKKGFF
jgi:hypothetical protein